ncbi:MAG TPA: DUF1634 domain-containing protein [Symbiobacteriaceae bacterium]|nr:DUF1634 domain-containing protein [Symbiobacteriaceae bacterium]
MQMTSEGRESRGHSVEIILAKLLRTGSLVAAGLTAAGIVLMVLGLAAGATVTVAGLVVLVSTPILRVSVAMVVFLKERDYLFAFFCLVVIASLGAGMVIGKTE